MLDTVYTPQHGLTPHHGALHSHPRCSCHYPPFPSLKHLLEFPSLAPILCPSPPFPSYFVPACVIILILPTCYYETPLRVHLSILSFFPQSFPQLLFFKKFHQFTFYFYQHFTRKNFQTHGKLKECYAHPPDSVINILLSIHAFICQSSFFVGCVSE